MNIQGLEITTHGVGRSATTKDPPAHEVAACRIFLRLYWDHRPSFTKGMRFYSSYTHKHRVENWIQCCVAGATGEGAQALLSCKYVSNGAFVQAALLEGYVVEVSAPNVYLRGIERKQPREGRWILDLDNLTAFRAEAQQREGGDNVWDQ